jgi:hypothetical protein
MISEEEKLIATLATQLYSNRNHEDSPTWTHLRDRDVITLNDFKIEVAVELAIDIIKETKKSTRFSSKEREPVEDDNPYRAVFDE